MEWGVIEFYRKEEPDTKRRTGMLNIRSERILDDPKSYWYKIQNRRCLIPVTGIYEHREVKGWKKKVPYHVRPKDQPMFFLPALYSVAEIVDKQTGELVKRWTFGLPTTKANEVMRNIHNHGDNKWRMPQMVPFKMAMEFLQDDLTIERYREILNYQIASEDLDYYPTDTIRTSKPRADGKPKNAPYDWDGKLPPLGEMNPEEPVKNLTDGLF